MTPSASAFFGRATPSPISRIPNVQCKVFGRLGRLHTNAAPTYQVVIACVSTRNSNHLFGQVQGLFVDSNESIWSALASRALRVLIARKESSYAHLAAELVRLGVDETARGVEGKTQRGTFRFLYFLQCLEALRADYPAHWNTVMHSGQSWEQRASSILEQEITGRPWLTRTEVSRRLQGIGEPMTSRNFSAHIRSGSFQTTLFIQCAVVCSFDEGLEMFVDRTDLWAAARAAMPKTQRGMKRTSEDAELSDEG
jgi:hypothetical protein